MGQLVLPLSILVHLLPLLLFILLFSFRLSLTSFHIVVHMHCIVICFGGFPLALSFLFDGRFRVFDRGDKGLCSLSATLFCSLLLLRGERQMSMCTLAQVNRTRPAYLFLPLFFFSPLFLMWFEEVLSGLQLQIDLHSLF